MNMWPEVGAILLHASFSGYALSGRRLTANSSLLRATPVTVVKHTPSSQPGTHLPSGSLSLKAEFLRIAPTSGCS